MIALSRKSGGLLFMACLTYRGRVFAGHRKKFMDLYTILGLSAAFFTTASYVPQAIKTIRTKDTSTISKNMYILLCIGGLLWIVYGIYSMSWPVIIANCISLAFSIIILIFKIRYK